MNTLELPLPLPYDIIFTVLMMIAWAIFMILMLNDTQLHIERDSETTKPTGEVGITLDAAIERMQELEKERDEARLEANTIRNCLDAGVHPVFPWEVDSK